MPVDGTIAHSVGRPGSFYFNVETNTDCDKNVNISDTFCLLFMTWFTYLDKGGVCYASCIGRFHAKMDMDGDFQKCTK